MEEGIYNIDCWTAEERQKRSACVPTVVKYLFLREHDIDRNWGRAERVVDNLLDNSWAVLTLFNVHVCDRYTCYDTCMYTFSSLALDRMQRMQSVFEVCPSTGSLPRFAARKNTTRKPVALRFVEESGCRIINISNIVKLLLDCIRFK